jgi:virulence-associated protein VagC
MSKQRRVRLCRNGRNQVVRIAREFELPGDALDEEFPRESRAPEMP